MIVRLAASADFEPPDRARKRSDVRMGTMAHVKIFDGTQSIAPLQIDRSSPPWVQSS